MAETNNLALHFPNQRDEAYARAQEFGRLTSDEHFNEIVTLMQWSLNQVRTSPRRAEIEHRWQEQEEEWQRILRDLMAEHAN